MVDQHQVTTIFGSLQVSDREPEYSLLFFQMNNGIVYDFFSSIRKHLYADMDRVSRIWEIELQAVLEINKLGHRKRILYSVGAVPPKIGARSTGLANSAKTKISQRNISGTTVITNSDSSTGEQRRSHRKNRQAPKPPTNESSIPAKMNELKLEIRAPSELLLGFPTGMSTQWRHTAEALVSGAVKYEVNVSFDIQFSLLSIVHVEKESVFLAVSGLNCGERITWNRIHAKIDSETEERRTNINCWRR